MAEARVARARVALAAGALLVSLLAAEAGMRLLAPQWYDTDTLRRTAPELPLGRYRRVAADPDLVYELEPGLDASFAGSRVLTDAQGVRQPEKPAERSPGALELVVLGDSTSFGWRVAYEQSYPALLAVQLEAAWGRPVHLVNRSVPGFNSEQELAVLRRDVLPGRPALVLWHVDHNDANPILEPHQPALLPPEAGDNALSSALLKACRRAWLRRELEQRLHETEPAERLGGYLVGGPLWERHVAALELGVREAAAAAVPLALVLFDCNVWVGDESREHLERLHEPLTARLLPAGAVLIDLYPDLAAHAEAQGWTGLQSLWLAGDDPHPSQAGHELVANLLARALLQRWPAPPGTP